MAPMTKTVFVLGLDDFHRRLLEGIRDADRYEFVGTLDADMFSDGREFVIADLLDEAQRDIDAHPEPVDAIIEHWDFPTSTILPILRGRYDLPGPSLEAVLRCEHKYWSRLEQKRVVPDMVPDFAAFDPFAERPRDAIHLDYPFWIKPIKSHSSHLGFRIDDDAELEESLALIRDKIGLFARPMNEILEHADLPDEIRGIGGFHCIAEQIIPKGKQCTVEGYVLNGEAHVYGVVDSLSGGRRGTSLLSYVYPSALPDSVEERMAAAAGEVMKRIGFDGAVFNIEFFHHEDTDALSLLEINPRISKSHAPLFELVDGASNHQVAIQVALGEEPTLPQREGEFPLAAKFMMRHLSEDAYVENLPDSEDLGRLRHAFPEVRVRLKIEEGVRLSDLPYQDSYSYELADVFLGGHDREELKRKYEGCKERMPLSLRPVGDDAAQVSDTLQ